MEGGHFDALVEFCCKSVVNLSPYYFVIVWCFLLQVGTDAQSYYSLETAEDDETEAWRAVCPYILFLTANKKEGELYVKVDRLCLYCGYYQASSEGRDVFLRAFDLLFKTYHVFDLEYHVFLSGFINFVEAIYKIGSKQNPSTKSLRGYIASYRKKTDV